MSITFGIDLVSVMSHEQSELQFSTSLTHVPRASFRDWKAPGRGHFHMLIMGRSLLRKQLLLTRHGEHPQHPLVGAEAPLLQGRDEIRDKVPVVDGRQPEGPADVVGAAAGGRKRHLSPTGGPVHRRYLRFLLAPPLASIVSSTFPSGCTVMDSQPVHWYTWPSLLITGGQTRSLKMHTTISQIQLNFTLTILILTIIILTLTIFFILITF